MKRKNFFLPEPLLIALKKESKLKDIGEAEIVRRALESYLLGGKNEKEKRMGD
jgi:hypothetical protein